MDVKIGKELHGGELSLGKEKGDCKRFRSARRLEKASWTR
jgi:hypothetical protein